MQRSEDNASSYRQIDRERNARDYRSQETLDPMTLFKRMTPEEKASLAELRRKTFWYTSMPIAIMFNGSYIFYARRKGVNPGILRPTVLGLFGLSIGNLIRQESTFQEIIRRHPDGVIAQEFNKRKMNREDLGPTEEGRYQRRLPEQYRTESSYEISPKKRQDEDGTRNYDSMGLDDANRPSMDSGGLEFKRGSSSDYSGPDDMRSSPSFRGEEEKKYTSYDEIRRKHRGLDSQDRSQNQFPFFDKNPSNQSNYPRQAPDVHSQPKTSGRRNKYGDLIEEL